MSRMNFKEDERRAPPSRRDLAVVAMLTVASWLAVVGAVRVAYVLWGWLQ